MHVHLGLLSLFCEPFTGAVVISPLRFTVQTTPWLINKTKESLAQLVRCVYRLQLAVTESFTLDSLPRVESMKGSHTLLQSATVKETSGGEDGQS